MPNGATKNWVRLCGAINGFRSRYNAWPTRISLDPAIYEDILRLFTEKSLNKLKDNIELLSRDNATVVAEDEQGRSYDYGKEGFPSASPDITANDWLDVHPDTPYADD